MKSVMRYFGATEGLTSTAQRGQICSLFQREHIRPRYLSQLSMCRRNDYWIRCESFSVIMYWMTLYLIAYASNHGKTMLRLLRHWSLYNLTVFYRKQVDEEDNYDEAISASFQCNVKWRSTFENAFREYRFIPPESTTFTSFPCTKNKALVCFLDSRLC